MNKKIKNMEFRTIHRKFNSFESCPHIGCVYHIATYYDKYAYTGWDCHKSEVKLYEIGGIKYCDDYIQKKDNDGHNITVYENIDDLKTEIFNLIDNESSLNMLEKLVKKIIFTIKEKLYQFGILGFD